MDTDMFRVVAAHELGHAFLHRTKECAFIKNHTLLLTSWVEREANMFAAELLIPDCEQDNNVYPKELLDIKLWIICELFDFNIDFYLLYGIMNIPKALFVKDTAF